jgi:predicted RNA-binding Zn ribbon-like protein
VATYLGDWLERRDAPASDLDLVVLLLNSLDLLTDPADRLTSLAWFREVLTDVGRGDLARDLRATDLGPLRDLRESLRAVFAAPTPAHAAALLNPMLLGAGAVPQLVATSSGLRLEVGHGQRGLAALQARLPAALAEHVARRGTDRLGTCAALPCQCAFVDHTRGRTRRFCCATCNDRAASRQYRQRQRHA